MGVKRGRCRNDGGKAEKCADFGRFALAVVGSAGINFRPFEVTLD